MASATLLIESATRPDRDRAIDALRAIAILGVVLGHWLVTALVFGHGAVFGASPLRFLPQFTPISWLFQTLAVFFLVGGQVAAISRSRQIPYSGWVLARFRRLFRPVAVVVAVWATVAGFSIAAGVDPASVRTLVSLVLSPMWFLLVFVALTAATPLIGRLHPAIPLAVVATVDLLRLGLGAPAWVGWVNLLAGWMVPFVLGAAWAQGRWDDRVSLWSLLLGGLAATVALVWWAGYPAAMVGVPGAGFSNLAPPSLAAVTFGLAQCGAAGLLRDPLRRLMRRPALWAGVVVANLSAMTIFLWHQTAMITGTVLVWLAAGPRPGLHTVPESTAWVVARLGWLPLFALILTLCCLAVDRVRSSRS
ncbi:acyltransferase family protein [Actinoplanes awajinensis]|uniref:Acyltransferase n=1 Tax=Actinoplanes awajinensis subsp. mycoplanecinus TaxID=135947 RepID=A0A0X3V6A8_9ACTN|nr:acyltransferase [Actinoplanes awajinensis]KUL39977.1 acyltransferase [Actinoplanes awajinensis subsp. mycoplanecinus]